MSTKGIGHRPTSHSPTPRGPYGRFISTAAVIREASRVAREQRIAEALAALKEIDPVGWKACQEAEAEYTRACLDWVKDRSDDKLQAVDFARQVWQSMVGLVLELNEVPHV